MGKVTFLDSHPDGEKVYSEPFRITPVSRTSGSAKPGRPTSEAPQAAPQEQAPASSPAPQGPPTTPSGG